MPGNWILGLNTASETLGVALSQGGTLRAELLIAPESSRGGHGERLQPAIATVCELAGVKPVELSGVAVAAGPGGFTGVRTGMAAAKAIALSLDLPVLPVPTLLALAHQVPGRGLISPMLDARKGKVFAALYRRDAAGMTLVLPEQLLDLTDWLSQLETHRTEGVVFVGEGAMRQKAVLAESFAAGLLPDETHLLRAGSVALLGSAMLERGEGSDAMNALPSYMREPAAIAGWENLGPA